MSICIELSQCDNDVNVSYQPLKMNSLDGTA
jgi:hypothetical protein